MRLGITLGVTISLVALATPHGGLLAWLVIGGLIGVTFWFFGVFFHDGMK